MRAVLAPMVADITFFEAIPGLMERLPPALQKEVESFRYAPWKATTKQMKKALQKWPFEKVHLARGADHPAPLQRRLPDRLPRPRQGIRRRHPQPRRRIQGAGDRGLPALRHHARRPHGRARPGQRPLHRRARRVARRRRHEAAGRSRRLGGAQSRLQHAAGQRAGRRARHAERARSTSASAPTARTARTTRTCTRRCGSPRSPPRCRARTASAGSRPRRRCGPRPKAAPARSASHKQIGRIAPGYKADIVFLDLHHINWIPMNDPVNQLVHTEDGSAVHSVMIGGRMVVENRKLLTVDLAQARRPGRPRHRRAAPSRWATAKKLYERLEKVVGTFCPGLAKAPLHIHRFGASHHRLTEAIRYAPFVCSISPNPHRVRQSCASATLETTVDIGGTAGRSIGSAAMAASSSATSVTSASGHLARPSVSSVGDGGRCGSGSVTMPSALAGAMSVSSAVADHDAAGRERIHCANRTDCRADAGPRASSSPSPDPGGWRRGRA